MKVQECDNCRWFEPIPKTSRDNGLGECRRGSPSASDGWPKVWPQDWCGDWSGTAGFTGRPK